MTYTNTKTPFPIVLHSGDNFLLKRRRRHSLLGVEEEAMTVMVKERQRKSSIHLSNASLQLCGSIKAGKWKCRLQRANLQTIQIILLIMILKIYVCTMYIPLIYGDNKVRTFNRNFKSEIPWKFFIQKDLKNKFKVFAYFFLG